MDQSTKIKISEKQRGDALEDVTHQAVLLNTVSNEKFPASFMCDNHHTGLDMRDILLYLIKGGKGIAVSTTQWNGTNNGQSNSGGVNEHFESTKELSRNDLQTVRWL